MDLSKAFDTINNELPLSELNAYGIAKQVLLVIYSYLANRQQRKKKNNAFSSWGDLIQ